MGLKIRGRIKRSDLDSRYNERMKNYTAKRLAAMTEKKKILAEEKRDKLEEAYQALKKELES